MQPPERRRRSLPQGEPASGEAQIGRKSGFLRPMKILYNGAAGCRTMSGTIRTSDELDARRRRIVYRAWHRGFREMDLIMGRFCDAVIVDLPDSDLDAFEMLIDAQDHDLYSWITGAEPVSAEFDMPLFRKLRDFHSSMKPMFA
jgi:antitoxin CptB